MVSRDDGNTFNWGLQDIKAKQRENEGGKRPDDKRQIVKQSVGINGKTITSLFTCLLSLPPRILI